MSFSRRAPSEWPNWLYDQAYPENIALDSPALASHFVLAYCAFWGANVLGLLGTFLGGVGLFRLGMRLMTDGLKMAAGDALRSILGHWTRTPLHGLFSGILITALVQSSSAVTVATIGFVNSGLLTLAQSIGVIYGTNIGTTMTGWVVVLVGFKVDIQALAIPLVGLGAVLELAGRGRARPIGQSLIGFGLFFLGISILKGTFEHIGDGVPLAALASDDLLGRLIFVGIGFVLTLLTQSSIAAFTIVVTAAAGGMIPLAAAAAAIIGANVGTTSAAGFAVIGATANARRVAAAHVVFNVLTGGVAVLFLPFLLGGLHMVMVGLSMGDSPEATLALFHSAFNLLGVLLLWPLTPRLVSWLEGHFREAEEDATRPRFLDNNIAATPALAIDALSLELARIGETARAMAQSALSAEGAISGQMAVDMQTVKALVVAMGDFATEVQKAELPQEIVDTLPELLRIAGYYSAVAEMAVKIAETQAALEPMADQALRDALARYHSHAVHLLQTADPLQPAFRSEDMQAELQRAEGDYHTIKAQLLRAGTEGRIRVRQMVGYLDKHGIMRRMLEQTAKGAQRFAEVWAVAMRYRETPIPAAAIEPKITAEA